jgi:thiamine kinase-like enzyme
MGLKPTGDGRFEAPWEYGRTLRPVINQMANPLIAELGREWQRSVTESERRQREDWRRAHRGKHFTHR